MMRQESARKQAADAMTREEFLASLELVVDYIEVGEEHVGRVAQLTNKTNQFNLTTIRRTEAEIRALLASRRPRGARDPGEPTSSATTAWSAPRSSTRPVTEWDARHVPHVVSRAVPGHRDRVPRLAWRPRRAARGATAMAGQYVADAEERRSSRTSTRSHGFTAVGDGEFRAELGDITPKPDYVTVR